MTPSDLTLDLPPDDADALSANAQLEGLDAAGRIDWALQNLPGRHLLSSSFGIQGALMLHLVTRAAPEIPVVLVDTGHLFPETYRFIDELAERLRLNLHVYRAAAASPAWQEARHGRLWEQGYVSVGDTHSTRPLEPGMREQDTRYFGLKRECGLHD